MGRSEGPTTALGASIAGASGGAIEGDFESSDIKFPQLKVVQGSGPLSGKFTPGTVILDEDVLAYPAQDLDDRNQFLRLTFIPLKVKKFYRETLSKEEQDDGMMPRIVQSKQQLMEVGGRVGYGAGFWREGGQHHILLQRPENLPEKFADSSFFDTELDGKLYAPAVFYANSGNYGDFTQPIVSATRSLLSETVLDEGGKPVKDERGFPLKRIVLWKYFWTWQLMRKQAGDFWVWRTPAICQKKLVGPEALAFCGETHAAITGGSGDPSAE